MLVAFICIRPTDCDARMSDTTIVDRHPIASFFALTFAFSWGLWIPALETLRATFGRLVIVPGAFGPLAAGVVVTHLQGNSVRVWLRSIFDWRRSPRTYARAAAVPFGITVVLTVLAVWLAGGITAAIGPVVAVFAINIVFATLLGGGQEEFGWRGFALPRLQARYDALTASIVVGVAWALWHAPMFAFGIYQLSPLPYAVGVVAFSVVLTWLYNSSRGCVPAMVLAHGLYNASVNVAPALVGGKSALPVPFTVLLAAVVSALAVVLVWRYGRASLAPRPVYTQSRSGPSSRDTTDADPAVASEP